MDINLTIYDNYLTPYILASSNILFDVDGTYIAFNSNANTVNATNIGGDLDGLFIDKVNDTLRFKSVDSGSFASVASNNSTIDIATSFSGVATSATNGLFISNTDGTLSFQNLVAGSFILIDNTSTTITINYSSGGGSINGATNIGGNTNGLFITTLSTILLFKNLAPGSFITFTNNNSLIGINAAPPVGTNIVIGATNIAGSVNGLFINNDAAGVLLFKNIFGGSFIQLVDAGTTVSIGYVKTGTSIVTGATNLGGNVNGFYLSLATTGALNFNGFSTFNTYISIFANNSVINITGSDAAYVTNGTNILGDVGGIYIGTISSLLMTFKNIYNGSFISITDNGTTIFIDVTEKSQTVTLGTSVVVQPTNVANYTSIISFPFALSDDPSIEYSIISDDPTNFSQRFERTYVSDITNINFTLQSVMKNSISTTVNSSVYLSTNFSLNTVNNGYPAVAYIDDTTRNLRFAINASPYGTGFWKSYTVDGVNQCLSPSLVELENGCPGIAYYESTTNNMRFASNLIPNGSGVWTSIVVDSITDADVKVSSIILYDGRPAMIYAGTTVKQLKYARNTLTTGFGAWSSVNISLLDVTVVSMSMNLLKNNYPYLAIGTFNNLYYSRSLSQDGLSDFWTLDLLNSDRPFSLSTAIAATTPAIAYENANASNSQLKYLRNSAIDGSGTWTTVNVTDITTINRASSLTVASDGFPCIVFNKNDSIVFARNNSPNGLGIWTTVDISTSFAYTAVGIINQIDGNLGIASLESLSTVLKYTTSQVHNNFLSRDTTFVVSWLGL